MEDKSRINAESLSKLFDRLSGSRKATAPIAMLLMQMKTIELIKDEDAHTNSIKMSVISMGTVTETILELSAMLNSDVAKLTEHVASLTARVAKLEGAEQ